MVLESVFLTKTHCEQVYLLPLKTHSKLNMFMYACYIGWSIATIICRSTYWHETSAKVWIGPLECLCRSRYKQNRCPLIETLFHSSICGQKLHRVPFLLICNMCDKSLPSSAFLCRGGHLQPKWRWRRHFWTTWSGWATWSSLNPWMKIHSSRTWGTALTTMRST